jgi:alpha-tubulin suppressor-like RCC1 family protein
MIRGSKNKRAFITVICGCFFLSAFVFLIPACTAGEIVVWGDPTNVLSLNTGFTAITAGMGHSLGLKQDGSIVAWGYNGDGQCDVPEPNTGFTAIACGQFHSLGLKQDGSVAAWGLNNHGQCNVPEPNSGFIAIAGGQYHSLGLKEDGSIVAWGYNADGECNVPEPNEDFIAISCGGYHSLALKQDGSIVAWGNNNDGECNVPEPNTGFSSIAGGFYHSLALKQDGSIVAWGDNGVGQLNEPSPNTGFTAISAGGGHSLGLKQDGSIVAWGDNSWGQCTVPSPNMNFSSIAAGYRHSLGLKFSIAITKCTVTAGKTQGQDAFSASGTIEFPQDLDFNDVNHIDVNIVSLTDSESIYTETADSIVSKGKFTYKHKIPRGLAGAITSLAVDYKKRTFSINMQKVDLTGLTCPLRLELTIGGPITGNHTLFGVANETILNGKKTLIPARLMRLYKDTLVVNKTKARHNSKKASSDSLSVAGYIAVEDMNLYTNEPNLVTEDVVLTWSDINGTHAKILTIAHPGFKASRIGHIYKCSKIHPAEDVNSSITAQFDLDKCAFSISVSKASSVFAGPADANFSVSFNTPHGQFHQTVDVNLSTGRSW